MDAHALASAIGAQWDAEIVPQLVDYIRIPAKSPHFDSRWQANGHIERVTRLAEAWAKAQPLCGLVVEIVRLPGRTPVLYFDVPAAGKSAGANTVLLYGHLDKQPEMTGWHEGYGPWLPRIDDGKLYGRGGADDGYAVFASLAAIGALRSTGNTARALRRVDRDVRRIGKLRPACVPRNSGAADGARRFRRRPRFRLRRLRALVGNDVAARHRRGHAFGRRADRGRALGRCERRRSIVVSRRPRAARPPRGFRERPRAAGRIPRVDP